MHKLKENVYTQAQNRRVQNIKILNKEKWKFIQNFAEMIGSFERIV